MKKIHLYITIVFVTSSMLIIGCTTGSNKSEHQHDAHGNHIENTGSDSNSKKEISEDHHDDEFTLTQTQIDILNISIDTISKRVMSGFIQANGQLGVPPQNEAIVTSIIGANISEILAIEGDEVRKGEVLAYISHPDIITLQTDYLQSYNTLIFLEQDYNRQKKLYDAQVGSGRDFQQAKSAFSSAKGLAKGYESQLRLLGLSAQKIREGNIADIAPVKSPINGFIEIVKIKSGQFVLPQTTMFEVVNPEHIHVDLMIFEKDAHKVKNGQKIKFSIEALGAKEMTANIYAVGKSFEEDPKALHVHAEIENKDKNLIPGMYVNARIITSTNFEEALPEDAIFQEGETYFVFTAEKEADGSWGFLPKEVLVKTISNGYVTFDFKDSIAKNTLVAQSGAYYLMAEMKKSEAEHSH